jgi:hypothetical protein
MRHVPLDTAVDGFANVPVARACVLQGGRLQLS